MRAFNSFVRQRRRARGGVEVLEERALLTTFVGPAAIEQVQVLEWKAIAADSVETAEAIAISDLPAAVLTAVNARLPQATILAAETDTADGSLRFGVRAEFQGAELIVTLSPQGDVLEVAQAVAIADLPAALNDWLAHQFPGVEIRHVERVTVDGAVSYELVIASSQQTPVEATVRLAEPSSSPRLSIPPAASGRAVATALTADSPAVVPAESASEPSSIQHDGDDVHRAVVPAAPVAANRTDNVSDPDSAPIRAPLATAQSPRPARPAETASIESLFASRLPLVERLLSEVLPVDFATIERALQEFLDGVDSLADPLAEAGPVHRWLPLLTAAAALFGIERVLSDRRKTDQDVVLATASRSSWTWVLKLSTVKLSRES